MIPEDTPSRKINPYEPPSAALDAESDENRPPEGDGPRTQKVVLFVRTVGVLHLIFAIGALRTPYTYLSTLLLVLRGTHSAPWLYNPVQVIPALYHCALSALSFAAAYGIFRRKRWTRGVVVAFLVVYFSLLIMGCIIEAGREPIAVVIFLFAFFVAIVTPFLVLAASPKLLQALQKPTEL